MWFLMCNVQCAYHHPPMVGLFFILFSIIFFSFSGLFFIPFSIHFPFLFPFLFPLFFLLPSLGRAEYGYDSGLGSLGDRKSVV